MAFKAFRRLLSSKLCSNKCINRLFGSSHGIERPNELSLNPKIKRVVSMLSEYDFNERQIDSVLKSIGKYIIEENQLNDSVMRETIECWHSNLRPPRLRPNQLDRMNAEDIDYDLTVDFNHVFSRIEPKLLLINANAIEFRINCIKGLAITGGSRDFWRVFVFAPNGYYLQSWTDFLKKYHYLSFRVLEWLLDKKDKNNLHPHPLIRNAKVMELEFETIRCRYLFAQRTGLKTVSLINRLTAMEDLNRIDLKAIMLSPIDQYLRLIAPNCSPEEYSALETLLSESPLEEDEQIIEDMVELTASKHSFKRKSNKERIDLLENSYQIISRIE